jgi:hypothetical protein
MGKSWDRRVSGVASCCADVGVGVGLSLCTVGVWRGRAERERERERKCVCVCASVTKQGPERAPCMQKIFSSMMAAMGRQLKQSVNVFQSCFGLFGFARQLQEVTQTQEEKEDGPRGQRGSKKKQQRKKRMNMRTKKQHKKSSKGRRRGREQEDKEAAKKKQQRQQAHRNLDVVATFAFVIKPVNAIDRSA